MNTGPSGGGWRSLKTVVAEHNDCHGEDEEVSWEHKLKASLVSIIHRGGGRYFIVGGGGRVLSAFGRFNERGGGCCLRSLYLFHVAGNLNHYLIIFILKVKVGGGGGAAADPYHHRNTEGVQGQGSKGTQSPAMVSNWIG